MSSELDVDADLPGKIAEDYNVIFSLLLGIERQPVPIETETVEYHEAAFRNFLSIGSVLIANQHMVAECLSILSNQPNQ